MNTLFVDGVVRVRKSGTHILNLIVGIILGLCEGRGVGISSRWRIVVSEFQRGSRSERGD